jgi:hypothetical protein
MANFFWKSKLHGIGRGYSWSALYFTDVAPVLSPLLSVVCRRAHVLFMLVVFVEYSGVYVLTVYMIRVAWWVSCKMQELLPRYYDGVRVIPLFSFLCCAIICLYLPSSVLWCPLRFRHKNDARFVFTSSCL